MLKRLCYAPQWIQQYEKRKKDSPYLPKAQFPVQSNKGLTTSGKAVC